MTEQSDLVVTLQEGKVRGKTALDYLGGTYYSFLGIPYGKAPIGELRFKAPVPAEPWEGIRDATAEGPECPSLHMFFFYNVGKEDNCLNLNVYTRQLPENNDKLKPVMVWVHGGGFVQGSNKKEFYGPDFLITEDIVLVTINYRLGALGFLSLEDPSLGVPGNAGLKDQVLALKWVQRNIKQFNGDPNNVTIFGESAGGASVHYLYLSPATKGLFHKVIAQSGCALNCWAVGCHNGKVIAKFLNYNENEDEKKILEHLKGVPAHKIVKAQHKSPDGFVANFIRPFGPVVEPPSEHAFLTEPPIEIIRKGTFNKVPIIMGYNSQEGIFFDVVRKVIPNVSTTVDFEAEIHHELKLEKGNPKSKEIANKIAKFYFENDKPSNSPDKVFTLKSDTQFSYGIYRSVSLQKLRSEQPVYLYRMSLETSLNFFKRFSTSKAVSVVFLFYYLGYKSGDGMARKLFMKLSNVVPGNSPKGVCHADDLGYLFRSFLTPKIEPGSIEDISVKKFVKLWTNFAKYGDPTPDVNDNLLNNVAWKPVTKETSNYLDIETELKMSTNPDPERMKFWDSIYNQIL